jgi:hypothetical protein
MIATSRENEHAQAPATLGIREKFAVFLAD